MKVRERTTLAGIARDDWNALVPGGSFYLSYDWLRSVEANRTAQTTYLVAERGSTLLGALPVYAVEREENDFYRPELISSDWQGRYLLAGSRRAYTNDLFLRPDLEPAEREDVLRSLVEALREVVARERADGALFLYVTTEAAEALAALLGVVPALVGADSFLRLPGTSFDDYLEAFSAGRRATVRRDLRVFAAAGYDTSLEGLSGLLDDVAPLLGDAQRRYGHNRTAGSIRAGLARQLELVGQEALVFCCRRGGRLVGCSLAYAWGDTLYMRTVGFDYDALAGAAEYFELAFYGPIRYAYDHGLRRLHLGRMSYLPKVLRGAALVPLWAVEVSDQEQDGRATEAANARAAEEYRPLLELQLGEAPHRGWALATARSAPGSSGR